MFDLGGVLIDLSGLDHMFQMVGQGGSQADIWARWLRSAHVQSFECGQIDPDQFAQAMLDEFALPVSAAEFLAEFGAWPKNTFPGATDLLRALAPQYTLACLTNTNALHWPRIRDEMGLVPYFNAQFVSHLLGLAKPGQAIFQHVIDQLGVAPGRILFLDDNMPNIESARAAGMRAERALGVDGCIAQLSALGVLPPAA